MIGLTGMKEGLGERRPTREIVTNYLDGRSSSYAISDKFVHSSDRWITYARVQIALGLRNTPETGTYCPLPLPSPV